MTYDICHLKKLEKCTDISHEPQGLLPDPTRTRVKRRVSANIETQFNRWHTEQTPNSSPAPARTIPDTSLPNSTAFTLFPATYTPQATPEPEPRIMPESPRMPRPGAKDAPVFDVASEDPRSYFKHLESLLEECKIESDAEKKRHTLRYLPEDVEDQWKYQDHYKTGTYANWKKEILRSYTGKSDEDRGNTIHQLRRIMKRFSNISITDAYEYAKMKREAQPVMAQVMENKYATNREITDLIWEVLTRDFAMAIRTRISLRRVEPAGTPITSENRYPYAEVLKIGQHLIDEANDGDTSGRSGRTYSDTSGTSVKNRAKRINE
ncbi:hypothetical protein K435DRAFT_860351 [Dendrothele bispora CBS 962.96]|uniref:Uncharacterized protein n=1 Tax=Dendrothele bispora (strain CBS 962.96) TaxID=1314807 RepID=A0A4S8LY62_DENBC|nr:hypothetical protein K435DRAFT_860351 [Dendrothele bispora CBS 962.96]